MSLILGLDQSITSTGVALFEFPGDERHIRCSSFSCSAGADAEEQCDLFCQRLYRIIGKHRPGFIVWERASRRISAYSKKGPDDFIAADMRGEGRPGRWTVNAKQLLLPEIQGAIRCAAVLYDIPYESVPVSTWRAAVLGVGGGAMTTAEANRAVEIYCRRLGIKAENDNEREAACIARWAATCSQKFKMVKWRREIEEAAA